MRTRRTPMPGAAALPRLSSTADTAGLHRLRRTLEADLVARLAGDSAVVDVDHSRLPLPWRERLEHTLAGMPGARRLVFNAISQPYLDATGAGALEPSAGTGLDLDALAGFAAASGLGVAAVVPYGALLAHPTGGESPLAPLDRSYRWRRSVSWLARDDDLLALARFLEHRLVAVLPPALAPYVMVALDADQPGDTWSRPAEAAPAATSIDGFADLLGLASDAIRTDLDPLLVTLKPRLLAFALLDHLEDRRPGFGAAALLTPERAAQYADWRRANRIDSEVTEFTRQWAQGVEERIVHGTDVTRSLDYRLIREVMEGALNLFDEVRR